MGFKNVQITETHCGDTPRKWKCMSPEISQPETYNTTTFEHKITLTDVQCVENRYIELNIKAFDKFDNMTEKTINIEVYKGCHPG